MKRKKTLLFVVSLATFLFACYFGFSILSANNLKTESLLSQNVEALTEGDYPATQGYSNFHFECVKYVNYGGELVEQKTGKYQSTCWLNPNSNKAYHDHSCSDCKSY